MYLTYRQLARFGMDRSYFPIMVRVKGGDPLRGQGPLTVAPAIREAIHRINPSAAVAYERTMNDVIARSLGQPRFYFSLLGAFAAVAILLAVAGLYGVLSYVVAQRTRELGIRAALGSSSGRTLGLVTRDGMVLVAIGMVLGLFGGAMVTRLMTFMLYGVSPLDGATWVVAAAVMVVAGLAATLVPAWRATRVDPLIAMRAE
jgi:ABC-type antimicrobial peptide transport system permease subunit